MATFGCVDAQGFAGGFTYGVVRTGRFHLEGKREMPGGFGVASTSANGELLTPDDPDRMAAITQVSPHEEWEPKPVPLVFGNPPCSGFSLLSHRDFRGPDSAINSCMWAFAGFAAKCHALVGGGIAVFESVQPAFTQGRELMVRLRDDMRARTGYDYTLYHVLHNARAVGGCAERRRYFALFSTIPFGVDPPDPLSFHTASAFGPPRLPTLLDAIGDLRGLARSWDAQAYRYPPQHPFAARLRSDRGVVTGHFARENPALHRAYDLFMEPADGHRSVPWPEGANISMVARTYLAENGSLPPSWAHQEEKLIGNDFKMGFYQLHRWHGNRHARVVTGAASAAVLHPTEPRSLSIREVARIQGFPDDWDLRALRHSRGPETYFGKGIPVQCGAWIADAIGNAFEGRPGSDRGECLSEGEYKINFTRSAAHLEPAKVR